MTCIKTTVYCLIESVDGRSVHASNRCNNPQTVCPRGEGEGYDKCTLICSQQGHAEVQAIRQADLIGMPLQDATAIILGHYYACDPCVAALNDRGITDIRIYADRSAVDL